MAGSRDHFPGAAGVPCGAGACGAVPPGVAGVPCGSGGIEGCPAGAGIVWAGVSPFMMLDAGRLPEK